MDIMDHLMAEKGTKIIRTAKRGKSHQKKKKKSWTLQQHAMILSKGSVHSKTFEHFKVLNNELYSIVFKWVSAVVPKRFWSADHLKYFSVLRGTKHWFLKGKQLIFIVIGGPLEIISRTTSSPHSRLWESPS